MTEATTPYSDKDIPTTIKAPVFTDGMIVTADDLSTAMHYPIDLMRALNRAYFGCGIVCGLGVKKVNEDPCNMLISVDPGTAVDCHGYPVHLPEACEFNITPDLCDTNFPKAYYIAVARHLIDEGPREDTDICEATGKPKVVYTRAREAAKIRIFDRNNPPRELCVFKDGAMGSSCDCLKQCTVTHCCDDEAWVLLAEITLAKGEGSDINLSLDFSKRSYIKPIQCACLGTSATNNQSDDIAANRQGLEQVQASDQMQGVDIVMNKAEISNLKTTIGKLEENYETFKKDLKQATDTKVEEKALNEKLKQIETTISQIEKASSTLEKNFNDKLKPAEIEKVFEKKFKAMEEKLAKLEQASKEQEIKEGPKIPAAKTPPAKTPPKPGNK